MPFSRAEGRIPMVNVIFTEMCRGNFSFLILVVGILQLIVMLKKK